MCQSSGQLPEPPSSQGWGVTMVTVSGCIPAPCLPLLNSACVSLRWSACSLLLLSHDQRQKVGSCNSSQPPFPETELTTDKQIPTHKAPPHSTPSLLITWESLWVHSRDGKSPKCNIGAGSLAGAWRCQQASASATQEVCCEGRWGGTAGLCTHTSLGGFQDYPGKQ